jgi:hypothetical protein
MIARDRVIAVIGKAKPTTDQHWWGDRVIAVIGKAKTTTDQHW